MCKPALPGFEHSLADLTIAIVTRNAVLREGLTAQIRAAGGEVSDLVFNQQTGELPQAIDVMLVDAGCKRLNRPRPPGPIPRFPPSC